MEKSHHKTLLAIRQSDEQKRSNEYARHQFIMAMMNLDEGTIANLLKEECKFLGNLNNWQFIFWLKKQFSVLDPSFFHSKHNEGISLDFYPGSYMYEFSYAPAVEGESNDPFSESYNDENIYKSKNAFIIKLTLLFENGKIVDVRIPRYGISIEKVKRCQAEN
jgi:hypothetical protein